MTIARHSRAAARPAPPPEPGEPRLLSSETRIPRTAAPHPGAPQIPGDRGSVARETTVDRSSLILAHPAGSGSHHFGEAAPPLR